jgi:cytochrome c-type biogenesis protein CcmH/NrfG
MSAMRTRLTRGAGPVTLAGIPLVSLLVIPLVILLVILTGLLLAGCSSYQGARFYHSGTRALDRGESARAIADLERSAELVPEASEVQNHLGLAYAAKGRDDAALRAFQRAVDLDCDNHAAAENLRVARRRAGVGEAR